MTYQTRDVDEGPQTEIAPRQAASSPGETSANDARADAGELPAGTALSRHWECLDPSAAELLGAVERNLETPPGQDDILERPPCVATALARARSTGPSLAMSASPERPKRWITALLVLAAVTLPPTTPAGKVDAGALSDRPPEQSWTLRGMGPRLTP